MKLLSPLKPAGSVLLVAVFTCLAVGLVLASFLQLVSQRHQLTVRSMNWNAAIPVAEAGVEEALSHLNLDAGSPSANGWATVMVGGHPVNIKQRNFTDGSYFKVTLYNAGTTNPMVYSAGFIPSSLTTNVYITRLIRVTMGLQAGLFTEAVASSGPISMNGTPGLIDSYDSRRGAYSPGNNQHAKGGVATDSTASDAIDIGNGTINGPVMTGPGGGISGGTIGDLTWGSGIEPGWTNNNFNVAFLPNTPPSGPFLPMPSGGVFTDGSYQLSNSSATLTINGKVTLYVTGNFSGKAVVNTNASLTLIINTPLNASLVNNTGIPANLNLVGLPGCTSIDFGGSTTFIGTINAPQADFLMHGTTSFYGAAMVASFTIKGGGHGGFHYDEALAQPSSLFMVSWAEL